jgi:SecA Wing and Scaffold domain
MSIAIAGLLDNFKVQDDTPIESELVVQALDKVQSQVEDYYRGIRAQVYKLDEVMASQRAAVYSQRRAFLSSTDDGMLETFTRWSAQTLTEIYEASLATSGKGIPPCDPYTYTSAYVNITCVSVCVCISDGFCFIIMRAGKPVVGGPVIADKLVTKALQFFPPMQLTVKEVEAMDPVSYWTCWHVIQLWMCGCISGAYP